MGCSRAGEELYKENRAVEDKAGVWDEGWRNKEIKKDQWRCEYVFWKYEYGVSCILYPK